MEALAQTYDRLADKYHAQRGNFEITHLISDFYLALHKANGTLLDLGCGTGSPTATFFLERDWDVHGVDISKGMLELAARITPKMKCTHCDMCSFSAEEASYDGVCAIYSFFHVPLESQASLLARIARLLKPEGKLLMTYATDAYTGKPRFDGTMEFMGERLYYGHETPEILHAQLNDAGLKLLHEEDHCIGGETFRWILCEK